jgi:ribosome-associated protein
MPQDSHPPTDALASKSQRKREAQALFDLGRALVGLDAAALGRLPLDRRLREAVHEARAIKSHIAHKRQLQFIARILRGMDAEPLRETARHHRIETWRDRLLAEGDNALRELLAGHDQTAAQGLRQLLRNAQRESARGKPPAAARKLFRLLRELDTRQPLPPP